MNAITTPVLTAIDIEYGDYLQASARIHNSIAATRALDAVRACTSLAHPASAQLISAAVRAGCRAISMTEMPVGGSFTLAADGLSVTGRLAGRQVGEVQTFADLAAMGGDRAAMAIVARLEYVLLAELEQATEAGVL